MKFNLLNSVIYIFIFFLGTNLIGQTTNLELEQDCIEVKPDPTSNQLAISGELSQYQIEILDDAEQVYQTVTTNGNEHLIDLCNFPDKIFFISITNASNNVVELIKIIPPAIDSPVVNPPIIQPPLPLIHLAENLDEQDQLGWCIDTQGNGFSNNLHTHSCKPSGGDVQFKYDESTNQICSAEYNGFCIEMSGGPVEGMSLNLVASDVNSVDQKFVYTQCGEFRPQEDMDLCLAAGETSDAAGIYMFRSLTLELSSGTDVELKRWIILE